MIVLVLGALAVCLMAVFANAGLRSPGAARRPAPAPRDDDPVEMLSRYGTSDDAARLIADGRGDELARLGYHGDES